MIRMTEEHYFDSGQGQEFYLFWTDFTELYNIKFYQNPSIENRVATRRNSTGRLTDLRELKELDTFTDDGNAPNESGESTNNY
jgi:hypothetical protein